MQGVWRMSTRINSPKKARRSPEPIADRLLPDWPAKFLGHPLKAWGWAVLTHQPDIPTLFAFEAEADRLQNMDARPTVAPFASAARPLPTIDCVYSFTMITYNALTPEGPRQRRG